MKLICAWCGSSITPGDGVASHGICSACREDPEVLQGTSIQDFIDSHCYPIVVVDGSFNPIAINSKGRECFPILTGPVSDYTVGAIVECDNAKLPESCEHTVHCMGCVLRKTITETNETGLQSVDVPVKLTRNRTNVLFRVSTTKFSHFVLVKLDKTVD